MTPTVKLISWTKNPIQTVYCLWQESKSNDPIPKPEEVDPNDPEVLKVFEGVVNSHIPVSDFLNFVFVLENISISFREQMVRHRVGNKFGARLGVDIVPELNDSSFWGQSMRILDMGEFHAESRFRVPESLNGKIAEYSGIQFPAEVYYKAMMGHIEEAYNILIKAGVPMEDARELIPLGATHRFSWNLNLTAIKHVIGKRSCWIPQMGLWEPIIMGMVEELATKVHPIFRDLVRPPCISGNKFKECVYKIDNERRISREDETLPCPLYLHYYQPSKGWPPNKWNALEFHKRRITYQRFWGRDPYTWEPLALGVFGKPMGVLGEEIEEGDPLKEGMEGL